MLLTGLALTVGEWLQVAILLLLSTAMALQVQYKEKKMHS